MQLTTSSSFDLPFCTTLVDDIENLKLHSCTKLESFILEWLVLSPEDGTMIPRLCAILALLQDCPNIRDITLYTCGILDERELSEVFSEFFIPVDDQLACLTTLTKVTIGIPHDTEPFSLTCIEEFARTNFPKLRKRGILNLCYDA